MLGRLMTDDELEGAEVDEDRQKPEAQEQPQSTTPDLDTEFMEQLTEEERQSEEDVLNPVGCYTSVRCRTLYMQYDVLTFLWLYHGRAECQA